MYDDTHDDEDEDKNKIRAEKWQTMSKKELVEKDEQGIYVPLKEIVSLQSQVFSLYKFHPHHAIYEDFRGRKDRKRRLRDQENNKIG